MSDDRILLVDIGNTNTHFAEATGRRILGQRPRLLPTARLKELACLPTRVARVVACCVVPARIPVLRRLAHNLTGREPLLLSPRMDLGIGIHYPRPRQIGADRLANAIAAAHLHGVPAIVVDFGTAVTFDIINARREYVGGVIAAGLNALTDYLHEKTAQLPRIRIREPRSVIGKSTAEAMRVGAVIGYRGLIREILSRLRAELRTRNPRVIATGGYAELIAAQMPEIARVEPLLTLQGLRILYARNHG